MFDKHHFYYVEHPTTKSELLDTMVGKLVADRYVPDIFMESIMEREELGQTNLNNTLAILIPRPMLLMTFKSVAPVVITYFRDNEMAIAASTNTNFKFYR